MSANLIKFDLAMSEERIRILVVDDHPFVREGLMIVINKQPDMTVVGEAESGQKAIELFRQRQPDITLMDVRMPGMNGIEATILIRQEFPQARILMLTTFDGDEDIHRALQAEAQGFLLKDMARAEVLKAIRDVHAGQRSIPPAVAVRLEERKYHGQLTSRELEILELIVKGMGNKQIAYALGITERTVKMHVTSILSKLGVNDRTQAVTTALQRGIVHLK